MPQRDAATLESLAFVVPVYNERETLEPLAEGIARHAAPHPFHVLFVDDGSTDGSSDVLIEMHKRHPWVDVVRFRRNFGKTAALAVGFQLAQGDIVFTMDADLQDDPKEIPRFVEALRAGFDMVCGWKRIRHDPWHKTISSRIYNRWVSRVFRLPLHDVNCGFKAMRADVARHLVLYGEMHRLIPVLAQQNGCRIPEIPVEHHSRRSGISKYGIERFMRGAADVITVRFLEGFGASPGHSFYPLGGFFELTGGLLMLGSIIALAVGPVDEALLLILLSMSVQMALAGLFLFGLGFVAERSVRMRPPITSATIVASE
ncbi:MAG: glycosyltransferase family 2 protein, partial [Candidatus Hydrogenedentes bacterium]|nr:glycosyltransferase family 2 protein [Candidatus Hydrogenedentota bacterium]